MLECACVQILFEIVFVSIEAKHVLSSIYKA